MDAPCGLGGGDCDYDNDCQDGLVCGEDRCGDFPENKDWGGGIYGPRLYYDCCVPGVPTFTQYYPLTLRVSFATNNCLKYCKYPDHFVFTIRRKHCKRFSFKNNTLQTDI